MAQYGVFGLNQFQLLWDTVEDAEAEAKRLAAKHQKPFCVMQKIECFDEHGEAINGDG